MKRILSLLILLSLILTTFGCSNKTTTTLIKQKPYELVGGVPEYNRVDVNLSIMNSTMTYSKVYDMMYYPENYQNMVVKMTGVFNVYEGSSKVYPAVIIKDATACCSQGIEFILYGDKTYPVDYPTLSNDITVIGIFKIYFEGENKYAHLVDAVIVES